ncbi:uncharacterized protein LOC142339628 isoform X2 [Convolutriloba macropyga]|uniref:uncharacterized protein LOC142339628 isoform X2 n=1 Tax=Convolutriloba macropyga TaxID=536237 RepID=UPI003F52232F
MDLNLELINWDMIGVNKQQFNGCYVNFKGARVLLFADCIANDLDYDEDVDVIGLPGARPEDFYQVLKLVLKENSYEIVAVLIGANCFSEYEGRASINPITAVADVSSLCQTIRSTLQLPVYVFGIPTNFLGDDKYYAKSKQFNQYMKQNRYDDEVGELEQESTNIDMQVTNEDFTKQHYPESEEEPQQHKDSSKVCNVSKDVKTSASFERVVNGNSILTSPISNNENMSDSAYHDCMEPIVKMRLESASQSTQVLAENLLRTTDKFSNPNNDVPLIRHPFSAACQKNSLPFGVKTTENNSINFHKNNGFNTLERRGSPIKSAKSFTQGGQIKSGLHSHCPPTIKEGSRVCSTLDGEYLIVKKVLGDGLCRCESQRTGIFSLRRYSQLNVVHNERRKATTPRNSYNEPSEGKLNSAIGSPQQRKPNQQQRYDPGRARDKHLQKDSRSAFGELRRKLDLSVRDRHTPSSSSCG